jgi:hypothetical protein
MPKVNVLRVDQISHNLIIFHQKLVAALRFSLKGLGRE